MTLQMEASVGALEVLDPVATLAAKTVPPAPRLADLNGRKIGLWSNTKPGATAGLEEVVRLLEAKFKGLTFERFGYGAPHGVDALETVVKSGCDAIISATAD